MTTENDPTTEARKLLLDVPDVMAALNIGRSLAFDLIKSGELGSVKVGRRRLVTVNQLNAYVAKLEAGEA